MGYELIPASVRMTVPLLRGMTLAPGDHRIDFA
jgi:hypothetical protein